MNEVPLCSFSPSSIAHRVSTMLSNITFARYPSSGDGVKFGLTGVLSRSIGLRGAGSSGPEAGFHYVQSKIEDWRKNEPTVKVEAGLEHMRHARL